MLARAEQSKGSALTEPEVIAIRNKSVCMMMPPAEADNLTRSRGFVDVNPENCWADWHRLRVQMTGQGYLPRIVLCIPGNDDLRTRCEPILKEANVEHEFRPRDANLLRAFRSASMSWPGMTEQEFGRIDAHTTVLYVLSKNFVAGDAPAVGATFLKLGRRLLEAGGIAIKCESSGMAHPPARWFQFDDNADKAPGTLMAALFYALVVLPIASKTDLYSCGMHLVGAPEMIASAATMQDAVGPDKPIAPAVAELFRTFAIYLLTECPTGTFASGHTFSIAQDAPRYRVVWEPCTRYAENDLFFNPFGQWRFTTA
jgi:hypothetical protein